VFNSRVIKFAAAAIGVLSTVADLCDLAAVDGVFC